MTAMMLAALQPLLTAACRTRSRSLLLAISHVTPRLLAALLPSQHLLCLPSQHLLPLPSPLRLPRRAGMWERLQQLQQRAPPQQASPAAARGAAQARQDVALRGQAASSRPLRPAQLRAGPVVPVKGRPRRSSRMLPRWSSSRSSSSSRAPPRRWWCTCRRSSWMRGRGTGALCGWLGSMCRHQLAALAALGCSAAAALAAEPCLLQHASATPAV